MPRKHSFLVVVLLGAVVMAGLVAVTRTVVLARPAQASTGSDPAIAYRLEQLDRFEASLRRKAAGLSAQAPTTTTVYRRASDALVGSTSSYDDEHEHEHEDDEGEAEDEFDD
jgi:hypothetical protein